MASDGKLLEKLLGKSVQEFGFSRSTHDVNPLCDRVQFLRNQNGRAMVWECKDVRKDYFQLTDMTQNERNTMRSAVDCGALAVIVFQHWTSRIDWQCWACTWQEWAQVEADLGFVEQSVYTQAGFKVRRKPGTASVSMTLPGRPAYLRPVPVVSGKLDLSYWVQ